MSEEEETLRAEDVRPPCPVCMHRETMRARLRDEEPEYCDIPVMRAHRFQAPPGAPENRDRLDWRCKGYDCGAVLEPFSLAVLLDAALMHSHPDCDSINADGIHQDVADVLACRATLAQRIESDG